MAQKDRPGAIVDCGKVNHLVHQDIAARPSEAHAVECTTACHNEGRGDAA